MRSITLYFFNKIFRSRKEPKTIDVIMVLLFFCVLTLPLSVRLNSIILIITLVYRLITYNWNQLRIDFSDRKEFLLPSILILVYSLGIIYSSHPKEGFYQLEKKFSLFALPFIFLLMPEMSKQDRVNLLKSFLVVIFLMSIVCYAQALYNVATHHSLKVMGQERDYYYFSYIFLTEPVSIDPIYLSMYTIFCILIVLHLYRQNRRLQILLTSYFVIFNFLIASRAGVLAMVILLVIHFSFSRFNRLQSVLAVALIVLGTVLAFFFIQPLSERFFINLHYSYSNDYAGNWNSVTMRLAIWNCAIETISHQWFFGYGTGDGLYALFDTYREHNFIRGFEDEYNAHNEFFFIMLDIGIIGLLSLLLLFIRPFFLSLNEKHSFFMEFIVLIVIFCLVEVILNRQKGVVFFSFFYGLFMSDILNSTSHQKNG